MDNKKVINNVENKAKVENEKIEALIPETVESKKKNTCLFVIIGILLLIIFLLK